MLWNFRNFTLKFINCEWWQRKQTNLQNNRNGTFLIFTGLFQRQTNWTLENWLEQAWKPKLKIKCRSLMKKTPKKQELVARPHLLPLVFYLQEKRVRVTLTEKTQSFLF